MHHQKDFHAFLRKYAEVRKDRKVSQATAPARIAVSVSAETPPSAMASASTTLEVTTATTSSPSPETLKPPDRSRSRGFLKFVPGNEFAPKKYVQKRADYSEPILIA